MDHDRYSSKILEEAVEEFSGLPGIGKKTALRLVLYLLKQKKEDAMKLGRALIKLIEEVRKCKICHNISDQEICEICSDKSRDRNAICVVESIKDVIAIENTQQFHGTYHILDGIISPMDGIGPGDLNITTLIERIKNEDATEVILALSTTMEGDTTNYYIFRKLASFDVRITTLARGISFGDDLEYADEVTLGKSINNRTPYEASISSNS